MAKETNHTLTVVQTLSDVTLVERFWPAFCAYISELMDNGYLASSFGFKTNCHNAGGCSLDALSLAIVQRLGRLGWPIDNSAELGKGDVLDLVEFFHSVVAVPKWFYCGYCSVQAVEDGDHIAAQRSYTEHVNGLFRRFNQPYSVEAGRVVREHAFILHRPDWASDFPTDDSQLTELLNRAVSDFFDCRADRKLIGLQSIVDAFERIKSMQGGDKKKSTATLIAKVSPDVRVAGHLDALFRELTNIGNEYAIRHHEIDKRPLDDETLVEFLFFSYYNLIRFALTSSAQAKLQAETSI
jgi:hypothetical protein